MLDSLWLNIVAASMVVVPLFVFLQDLRDRAMWVREADNAKEMVRRLVRETIVMLLYLIALCLYLALTWWILSQPLSDMK
jgi:hypothetical protein